MTAQRTWFIALLLRALVRGQNLAVKRKITLCRLWRLTLLIKGIRVKMVSKMNTMEYKTWKLRVQIMLETMMQYKTRIVR